MRRLGELLFPVSEAVDWLNEPVVTLEVIVGKPDAVEETWEVEAETPEVLFSDATDIDNEDDEEVFMDADGSPDDVSGADVTLALTLGFPDAVEVWNPDRFVMLGGV